MMLFGIASIMFASAAILYGIAAVCKAVGLHVPEKVRELTPEEKEALNTQAEANRAYAEGIQNIVFGATPGGNML